METSYVFDVRVKNISVSYGIRHDRYSAVHLCAAAVAGKDGAVGFVYRGTKMLDRIEPDPCDPHRVILVKADGQRVMFIPSPPDDI